MSRRWGHLGAALGLVASVLAVACVAASTLPPVVKIGAIFTEEEKNGPNELAFKYAIHKINKDKTLLPYTSLVYDIQYVPRDDSFHASKKACQLVHYGVHAIFGPSDPLLGAHIHSICDALDIPHLEARLDIESDVREFSINLHPTQHLLNDAFQDVMNFLNWTRIAIIYEKDYGLLKLRELVRSPQNSGLEIHLRQANPDSYQDVLMEIKSKEIHNVVIDTKPLNLQHFLKGILQLQMNDYKYHYLFTTFDMEAFDLEDFKYNFVNITAFRIVDIDDLSVKEVIRNMVKFQHNRELRLMNSTYIQVDTYSSYDNHILSSNWTKPILVLDLCKCSRTITVWDLQLICQEFLFSGHKVIIPYIENMGQISHNMWTTEGGAYFCDTYGSIYTVLMVETEFNLERVYEANFEGNCAPSIIWYKAGIGVCGPDKAVRHYVKNTGKWTYNWTIHLQTSITKFAEINGKLMGIDENGEMVQILDDGIVTYLKGSSRRYDDFCTIAPLGEYIVGLRREIFVDVIKVETGEIISTYKLESPAVTINENPVLPYFVLSNNAGILELISAYNPEKLSAMVSMHLTHNPIDKIKYFEKGRIIVTAFLETGEMFIVEGLPGTQLKVVAHVEVNRQVVNYMLVASKTCYRLYVIPVTSEYLAGNEMIRYCITDEHSITVNHYFFESKSSLYTHIIPSVKPNRDRIFFGVPFRSRNIHELEIRRGDSNIKVISEIHSGHLLGNFVLNVCENFVFTQGHDGFVFVRDPNFQQEIAAVRFHHRYDLGVKKAKVNASVEYIITLGYDNVLCCSKVKGRKFDDTFIENLICLKQSDKYKLMFKRPTMGLREDGVYANKTYVEIFQMEKFEKEQELCKDERNQILEQFEEISVALTDLVTKNLEKPALEKIDLIEFYLNSLHHSQKRKENREKCKNLQAYLKALIDAQDLVVKHMIKTYSEHLYIQAKLVRGISEGTMVANYAMLPPNEESNKRLYSVEDQRKIEEFLFIDCLFQPWLPISKDELLDLLEIQPKFTNRDYNTQITPKTFLEERNHLSIESQIAYAGASTQLYIDRNPWHYKQRQLVSFYQLDLQQTITNFETVRLREHHNVKFNNLAELKVREMDNIKEKHDRLRYIVKEYNYFSDSKIDFELEDPQWRLGEHPDLLMKVSDKELSVVPYVSPSEQSLIDAKTAEEERIRLALLADDFREKALYQMMSGVLETRWEDVLKRKIPLPKCMIEKRPVEYTEEDKRNIKEYEEKIIFRNSEIERYKHSLEIEFNKTSVSLQESTKKFNLKLKDTFDYKMCVDGAIIQEDLIVSIVRLTQIDRILWCKKDAKLKATIEQNERIIRNGQDITKRLNERFKECKASLEAMKAQEKDVETLFKTQLQGLSLVVQKEALKIYRRRPKFNFRQIISCSVLRDVAKCVITKEKFTTLSEETLQYLRTLDNYDEYIGVIPAIDETCFHNICKHRRLKIEFEIKQRACHLEVVAGEVAIVNYQKRFASAKEKNDKLTAELRQSKENYLHIMHNIPALIVLRRGLVEIPITGDITHDFDDSILVSKKELEKINDLIKHAGNIKLKTIRQNMAFRRKIMVTEWDHKRLRMTINDLVEQIYDINATKLLRDMQVYSRHKAMGRQVETDSLQQEIDAITALFETNMRARREKLIKIQKQLRSYQQNNKALDSSIHEINVDVCALKFNIDPYLQGVESEALKLKFKHIIKRGNLVRTIQKNQSEILVLQTELELLRQQTYPTFECKIINSADKN